MSETDQDRGKKQMVLRLSPSLHREITAWAQEDFRSVNGQIEFLLTECLRRRKRQGGQHKDTTSGDEGAE